MSENTYVKTVYGSNSHREPSIQEYDSEEEAQAFVDTCLKWGIDIVSCEIVPQPTVGTFLWEEPNPDD